MALRREFRVHLPRIAVHEATELNSFFFSRNLLLPIGQPGRQLLLRERLYGGPSGAPPYNLQAKLSPRLNAQGRVFVRGFRVV